MFLKCYSKNAFTLAEVLITLGIVGVVASLTMPSIIKHYQHKALEASFKKSYANLYNALNKAMIDSPEIKRADNSAGYPPIADAILKEYKKFKPLYDQSNYKFKPLYNQSNYIANVKTYTKSKGVKPECSQVVFNATLPDGSAIGFFNNCNSVWVSIDTNGLNKGPNAYGHDYFLFNITDEGKLIPATREIEGNYDENGNKTEGYNYSGEAINKCSLTSQSRLNGILCANYALQNKCPYDENKTYWECLP